MRQQEKAFCAGLIYATDTGHGVTLPRPNVELNAICFRFGGRIHELRGMGYDIRTGEKHGGIVEYEYRGTVTPGQLAIGF